MIAQKESLNHDQNPSTVIRIYFLFVNFSGLFPRTGTASDIVGK